MLSKEDLHAKVQAFMDKNCTNLNVRMSDCVQGIEPCKCKGKGFAQSDKEIGVSQWLGW